MPATDSSSSLLDIDKLDKTIAGAVNPLPGGATPGLEGQRVGPFEVRREIGRGGMGVVYQAHDPRLERDLALKFLPRGHDDDPEARERLLAEARAASVLDHPNICTIFDVGETDDGGLYIAMAYYDGETLEQKIARGPLAIDESIDIALQIARGLERAHEAGVIHRDVKPSNVLVTTRGEVKVLDFGIAKLDSDAARTGTGTVIGSAAYMAPEQARGEGVDARADLWSLGVVLYEMLCGESPFIAANPVAALYRLLEHDPPPLREKRSEVTPALSEVVRRALAKVPSRRYGDVAELAFALRSARAPDPQNSLTSGVDGSSVDGSGVDGSGVDGNSLGPAPGQLPAALSSFVGRRRELREVTELLTTTRLVTLTGPGGTGKTRLALEAAGQIAESFAANGDGSVFFVPLASIRDPELVPATIAGALGVTEKPQESTIQTLLQTFCDQRKLLVLDNFEQVASAAPVVARLLAACPRLVVLVTSRAVLRLDGEHVYPVPSLELPAAGDDTEQLAETPAVALFSQRARAARPGFVVDDDNAGAVAEICRRLDGLPLAIELAASRVRLFSPEALLPRLQRRLEILRSGERDRPQRHQTLRQAIAWSHDLLSSDEQALFQRLAVFVGGFSLEAGGAVAGSESTFEMLDGVTALVDNSLLRQAEDKSGEPRFQMLETIREFALELLEGGEEERLRDVHAEHFLTLAEHAETFLTGARPEKWMRRLATEHDNLRAALAWFEKRGEARQGLRLGAALWRFWFQNDHLREGYTRLKRLLALPGAESRVPARARALFGAGTIASPYGDPQGGRRLQKESLSIHRELDDAHGIALSLNHLAWLAVQDKDGDRVRTLSEEALELHRQIGDHRGMAVAFNNLGWAAADAGRFSEARGYQSKSVDLRRQADDRRGIAFALANLAWAEHHCGEERRARRHLDEALDILKDLDDSMLMAWTHLLAGRFAADRGELEEAVARLEMSLPLWKQSGSRSGLASILEFFGLTLVDLGRIEQARPLLEEAMEIWAEIDNPPGAARSRCGLGQVAQATGKLETAAGLFAESLQVQLEADDKLGMAFSLEALAGLRLERGDAADAARLWALAETLRETLGIAMRPIPREKREEDLAAIRLTLGEAGFARAWTEGSKMTPRQALGEKGKHPE